MRASLRVLGKNFEFARGEQAALDTLVSASFPALLDLFRHLLKQPEPSLDTFNLLMKNAFLDVTYRRANTGVLPNIAHGSTSLARKSVL